MTMPDILSAFANEPLFAASAKFLTHLGVKFSTQTEEPIPFLELYEEAATEANATIPKDVKAIFSRVENTYFIGTVTDDTLKGENAGVDFKAEAAAAKPKYEGMFVFAVEMKPGKTLKRSEAAVIVRGINRVVRQQPATVLILEDTMLSVATCERTAYKQTWRPGERLGKVSILKGVNTLSPHRGHIDILESMNVKDCKTFDALYKRWKDVFSTSLLTKQFYREIQNWYFWALKKEQHVAFPNALDDDSDDEKYNAENIIRLITRLIFTWFMKEKGLVNPDLFNPEFLKTVLKSFNPDGAEFFRQDLQDSQDFKDNPVNHVNPVLKQENSCTYYRAILQNLFFATFNQEVGLRDFVDTQVRDAKRYNIKNYYRNEKLFTETDKAKIIGYFNGSPFVNGGLFECLDNVEQNGRVYSWDGFSNSVHFKDGSLKSALIPDCLFFGGETTADLSEFFEKDKSAKSVKVRGIINILNDYVFTIEENTPFDEDVALDPELLGKVFENLLGCYNPETQQMARNATGSFYTPREIVNYMVKVSLKSYLKRACPKVVPAEIDALVEGVAELAEMPSVKEYAKDILTALFKAKILDPACGSGAFPMGIMSAMVEILRTVDPDNKHWYEIVLKESLDEAASIADVGDEQERAILKAQIEYDFKERVDHPDYARKLYIIEHCIFGSDIQPIAVQISRLRFFITLLCEQTRNDDPTKNYGITPLPNLESNFVAANSLLSIDLKDMRELLGQKKIVSLVKQLRGIRHQLFLPKTSDKKKRLQAKDAELREAIAVAAEGLYDENIELKCAMLKSDIKRCDEELAKLGEDDFKDVVKDVEEVDLFGNKTVTKKKVVGRGNELLKKKKNAESLLASLMNASRKERLLSDLKRLVAWNPFAFNVAESFLDPEWMFGVKKGFDIVVGNPPYVKLETIKDQSRLLETQGYEVFTKRGDLYCIFTERGFGLLGEGGTLSYIMSNKWLQAEYGRPLRKYFLQHELTSLIDFGDNDLFKGATVYPCIFVARKAPPVPELDCVYMKYYDPFTFVQDIRNWKSKFPVAKLTDDTWVLSETTSNILEKLQKSCVTLSEFIKGEAYYGIKPGATAAFIIPQDRADELIRTHESSRSVILPVLRGRDIKTWYSTSSGWYMIGMFPALHLNIDDYPAIKEHFLAYGKKKLEQTGEPGSRKKTCNAWFETQDQINYYELFSKPKIMYQKFQVEPCFIYDEEGLYCNDSMWIMPTPNKALVGVLNSKMGWWLISKFCTQIQNGYQLIWQYLGKIPVPKTLPPELTALVEEILAAKKENPSADVSALEEQIDKLVFDLYDLTDEEREIVKGGGK